MPLPVVLSLLERGIVSPRDRDLSIRTCRSSCGLEFGSCRPFSRSFVGAGWLLVFFSLLGCDGIIVILLCLRGCASAEGFASGFDTLYKPINSFISLLWIFYHFINITFYKDFHYELFPLLWSILLKYFLVPNEQYFVVSLYVSKICFPLLSRLFYFHLLETFFARSVKITFIVLVIFTCQSPVVAYSVFPLQSLYCSRPTNIYIRSSLVS